MHHDYAVYMAFKSADHLRDLIKTYIWKEHVIDNVTVHMSLVKVEQQHPIQQQSGVKIYRTQHTVSCQKGH